MIPFIRLEAVHRGLHDRMRNSFNAVLEEERYLEGKYAAKFEESFAAFLGVKYCVSCASGTDALFLMMQALNYQPQAEIIMAGNSFIATALSVAANGYIPVAADTDPETFNIHPETIAYYITPRTRAVLITHMYGKACDMVAIQKICTEHGLDLLEDASHAHGLKIKDKYAGTFGKAAAFSFYPTKNLGALGDAGAVVCQGPILESRMDSLKNYGTENFGKETKYGRISRMDEIQAAVLLEKLPYLDIQNNLRKQLAIRYIQGIQHPGIKVPAFTENHVWHLFVIRCVKRDALQEFLLKNGIATRIHYEVPYYQKMGLAQNPMPVTESLCREVLSLPLYPGMDIQEQDYIIKTLNAF